MRHPGAALTRQQLLDHAWDSEYEAHSNAVDVYVGYLRDRSTAHSGVQTSRPCAGWDTGWWRGTSSLAGRWVKDEDPGVGSSRRAVRHVGIAAMGPCDRADDRKA